MNVDLIISAIDNALSVADNVIKVDTDSIVLTKRILNLLKEELINNPHHISERILRASVNVAMYSFKEFENTPLENALIEVSKHLYDQVPNYKKLRPLGADIGTGDPI